MVCILAVELSYHSGRRSENRTYCRHEVTPDWIHGNAVESVKLLKSSVPGWLSRLKGDRWLEGKQTELNQERKKYLPKIKEINPNIDV